MSTTETKVVNLNKKQTRRQSPADKLLKFKRGLDALLPLAIGHKELEEDAKALRQKAFETYTKAEMKLPESDHRA